jgi:hypothetical protein
VHEQGERLRLTSRRLTLGGEPCSLLCAQIEPVFIRPVERVEKKTAAGADDAVAPELSLEPAW